MADNLLVRGPTRSRATRAAACCSVQEGIPLNWGFIIPVGTILFFAALHQWPPDGRRWERDDLDEGVGGVDPIESANAEPLPPNDGTIPRSRP